MAHFTGVTLVKDYREAVVQCRLAVTVVYTMASGGGTYPFISHFRDLKACLMTGLNTKSRTNVKIIRFLFLSCNDRERNRRTNGSIDAGSTHRQCRVRDDPRK